MIQIKNYSALMDGFAITLLEDFLIPFRFNGITY